MIRQAAPVPPRGGPMNVHLKALNERGELYFESEVAIDPMHLIKFARERAPMFRAKGQAFAEGSVPFYGSEMLKAAQAGDADGVHFNAINAAMGVWLSESIFGSLTETEFIHSNLHLTVRADGAVKVDRIRIR